VHLWTFLHKGIALSGSLVNRPFKEWREYSFSHHMLGAKRETESMTKGQQFSYIFSSFVFFLYWPFNHPLTSTAYSFPLALALFSTTNTSCTHSQTYSTVRIQPHTCTLQPLSTLHLRSIHKQSWQLKYLQQWPRQWLVTSFHSCAITNAH
jgi:hypothetical protein